MAKKKGGLAAMLTRSKENEKIQAREKYAIQKQNEMKDNAKLKRRKQSTPKAHKLNPSIPAKEKVGDEVEEQEGDEKKEGEEADEEKTVPATAEDNDTATTTVAAAEPRRALSKNALIPFEPTDTVLLVGEGDFSFAVSVLKQKLVTRLVPTSLDTEAQVLQKYGEKARQNIEFLRTFVPPDEAHDLAFGGDDDEDDGEKGLKLRDFLYKPEKWSCAPLFGVDATKLNTLKPIRAVLNRPSTQAIIQVSETELRTPGQRARANANRKSQSQAHKQGHFDSIVFNFPHTGSGLKDQARNVLQHQQLLTAFLGAARPLLMPGSGCIAVSLFDGLPYELWGLKGLARQKHELVVRRSGVFDWALFPGYYHRLTSGGQGDTTKAASSRTAKYYVLERFEDSTRAEANKKKNQPKVQLQPVKGKKLKKLQAQQKKKQQSDDDSDGD